MGLFDVNPGDWWASIKDDELKRTAMSLAVSMAYSAYITFLFQFGSSLKGRRFVGFLGDVFIKVAASAFKLLSLQDTEKLIYLSVPVELANNQPLLDSIYWEKEQTK